MLAYEYVSIMEILFIAFVIALKFLIPIATIFFPFAGAWSNYVLDSIDGDILIPLGLENASYQPIDKIADWVTYVAMVVLAYKAKWPIKKIILGLFLFRSIGQTLFLATGNELFFFYFPNFLEPLVLVTVSILAYQRVIKKRKNWHKTAFDAMLRHRYLIAAIVIIYKMQDEYFTHVANIDRTEFIGKLFGG